MLKSLDRKNTADILSLTPLQEGLLFHYLKTPGSEQYVEQLRLEISGILDHGCFEKTWNFVVETNEMLRAVFRWEKMKKPSQVILKEHHIKPVYYDLSGATSSEKNKFLEEITAKDRKKNFALRKAEVPFRVTLCKIEKAKHVMIISNHHILYDGWSTGIILKEFFEAYNDFANGKQPKKPVKTKFKEFIREIQNRDITKEEIFWQSYLQGLDTQTGLAVKRRTGKEMTSVETYRISFESEVKDKLEDFVKKKKITLSSLLYSAWGLLLQKYNNSEDVLFGTTVSGRSAAVKVKGIEDVVGLFINTLPLRVKTPDRGKIEDLLDRINRDIRIREEYENTPLVAVKECLGRGSNGPDDELFDCLVAIENYPLDSRLKKRQGKLSPGSYSMVEMTHYDLTVSIVMFEGIEAAFIYNRELFETAVIERLAGHFGCILDEISRDPGRGVHEIDILSETEKRQLLEDFNDTEANYPADKTIHWFFEEQAARTPDSIAVVGKRTGEPVQLTYNELNKKSHQLADLLGSKGITPGAIAAIKMERSLEMVIGILGILKAGGVYLPILPDYPAEREQYILRDSNAKILLAVPADQVKAEVLTSLTLTSALSHVSSTDMAYVIYTSGSTGKPKGVMVEHASAVNILSALQKEYPFMESDVYLLKTSVVFDVSVTELFGWFFGGGRLAVLEKDGEKDPWKILDTIERQGVTHINFVPSMFTAFVEVLNRQCIGKLSGLRYIFLAGEALLPGLIDKFRHLNMKIALENIYGPTEGTVYASKYSLGHWQGGDTIPIGEPVQNTRLYILDKFNRLQPVGVPGELCIEGAGVARGYLNKPELTAERFLSVFYRSYKSYGTYIPSKKIYKTGDLCRWLPDGNIEYLGRMDHQVKIRGFRVELGEIESRLSDHPSVKEAVVTLRENQSGDKYLCAYVVPHSFPFPGFAELRGYLSQTLPHYMIPAYFVKIEEMPLTSTGKIDRKALPEPEITAAVQYAAPRNEKEVLLVEMWSGMLGIEKEKIGIDDNFFELGGHSLKAIGLTGRIHKAFNIEIPITKLFKIPTVRGLSDYIDKAEKSKYREIKPIEKKDYYPLSSAQKRLFVLHQMDKGNIAYNMSGQMILEGRIEKDRLDELFKEIINRHESLRTSFGVVDDEPVQWVRNNVDFVLEYYDQELPASNESCQLPTVLNFVRPFDLTRAPLMRVGLIRTPPFGRPSPASPTTHQEESLGNRYILMVDMHHIVSDGISVQLLIKEFLSLYAGEKLPTLRVQYKDFSNWQNARKTKEEERDSFIKQEIYWLKEFEEEIPALDLPTDFTRPVLQSFEGNTLRFKVCAEDIGVLKTCALAEGATLFMVLFAIYNIFISRISSQETIVIGTPTAGRGHTDLEKVIGMFVNTLALKNYPVGKKRFIEFLREIKKRTASAFENQEYPFEDLVTKLTLKRDASRNPLFDVMFAMQNMDISNLDVPGLRLRPYEYDSKISRFDLTFYCEEKRDDLFFAVEYSTNLFKESTIEKFIRYFKNLVSAAADAPDIKIEDMEIISEEEKGRLLYDFNNTSGPYPADMTIHELFAQEVEKAPDRTAVVGKGHGCMDGRMHGNIAITFRELNEKSNQLAWLLKGKGVKSDTIVGIMMGRSIGMIIGILGILKAGGAYLPIDLDFPEQRIAYMLSDSGAKILLTDPAAQVKVKEEPIEIIDISYLSINSTSPSTLTSPCQVGSGNLAYIIYTSGTTGKPKGVLTTHFNAVRVVRNSNYIDLKAEDRVLQLSNYAFDGSVFDIYGALLNGAVLVLIERDKVLEMEQLAGVITREQVTVFFVTTALFNALVDLKIEGFASVKKVLFGGERVSVEHSRRALEYMGKGRIIHVYGPTETTVYATYYFIDEIADTAVTIPIGKPISNTVVYLLDKSLKPVPVGLIGEVFIGGKGTARGYLNSPLLTVEKFIENPFMKGDTLYRTGDLAGRLPDGNIEFIGRSDFQVKIRGFRIEPGEVENRLLEHEKIKETVIEVREEAGGDRYLCAYIVLSDAAAFDRAASISSELKEYLSQKLPDYMVPSCFVVLKSFPLTANGKVDRKALPEPDLKRVGKDYIAPRNQLEEKLAGIWGQVLLGRDTAHTTIGIDDNFFESGGHSLKATILISKIHKELNAAVPLAEIFRTPTIRGIAVYIAGTAEDRYASIEASEKKEYYPVSSAQKRLYVLQKIDPESTGYNMPAVMHLEGELKKEKFADTFKKLMERHESLRTSFEMMNDEPVQRIHDNVIFEVEYGSVEIEEKELYADCIESFIRPFDLSQAPLLRVGLIRTPALTGHPSLASPTAHQEESSGNSCILMVDMHHIISDGTSMGVFVREFMSLYGEERVPPLRVHYKDFSEWQNRKKEKESGKQQEVYWLREFAGEIPVLNLPVDFPRPVIQSFVGSTLTFEIEEEETEKLKTLALTNGATLYMVLLALFNIFLAKLSGQEEIVVGSPAAGRRHVDLEHIIGMFVNTLALRNYPTGQKRVHEFLNEVRDNTLKAQENQDYQFEDLVELLAGNVKRDPGRNPLFDVMFVLQNIDILEIEIPGLKLTPYEYENRVSKFDLLFVCEPGEKNLGFSVTYSSKLFRAETIRRFFTYFRKIISSALHDQNIRIMEIEVIAAAEKKEILYGFNDTRAEYPADKTVHDLFAVHVEKNPDRIAVTGSGSWAMGSEKSSGESVQLTYRALNEKSAQLACSLREKGVQPGTIVGIMVERSLEMILGIFSIMKAGGAYLPIEPSFPGGRRRYILADSGVELLLTKKRFLSGLEDCCESLDLEDTNLYSQGGSRPAGVNNPGDLAYVIYTSGSTGKPKGVIIEHRPVVNRLNWMQRLYPLGSGDVILQKTPFTFDVSVWELFWWSMQGASVCLLGVDEEKSPKAIMRAVERNKITTMHFVPSMLHAFLEYIEDFGGINRLASLRQVFASGEALGRHQADKFNQLLYAGNGTRLINLYGPTEATVDVSYYNCSPCENVGTIPIGKPIDNIYLYVVDNGLHLQPVGVSGELCISGAGLARGYLNKPELTAERFDQDLWDYRDYHDLKKNEKNYKQTLKQKFFGGSRGAILQKSPPGRRRLYKTGDLARWLPDGNIEFLGRIDHQIKIRGFRIELGEIETQLLSHEDVEEAVVILYERKSNLKTGEEEGGKYLAAYIIPRKKILTTELREYLSARLPYYMIPSFFVQIDKIPLTANGKVDRNVLLELFDESFSAEGFAAPTNEMEEKLAAVWEEVLGLEKIGIDDNFFNIGGDSIKAIKLINRVDKVFASDLEIVDLYFNATIRKLADKVSRVKTNYRDRKFREICAQIEELKNRIMVDIPSAGNIEDIYPMSDIEKGMMFYSLRNVEAGLYHDQSVYLLKYDRFDIEAYRKAFILLARKHSILRTAFNLEGFEEPVQIVYKEINPDIEHADIPGLEKSQQEKYIKAFLLKDLQHPFDLSVPPLWRLRSFDLGRGRVCIVLVSHHTVLDGWSLASMMTEFNNIYMALQSNPGFIPEGLKNSYRHFVIEQMAEKKKAEVIRFWQEELAGYTRLDIAGFPGNAKENQGVTTANLIQDLGDELPGELEILAAKCKTSLQTLCFAAYIYMLYMISYQDDFIVGLVTNNRPGCEDGEKILGCFLNTVPFRVNIPGNISWSNYINLIDKKMLGLKNYDRLSLFEIIRIIGRHAAGENPLFDTLFGFVDFHVYEQAAGLEEQINTWTELSVTGQGKTNTLLDFAVSKTFGSFGIIVNYAASAFDNKEVRQLTHYFTRVLNAFVHDPDGLAEKNSIMTAEEKQKLLAELNGGKKISPLNKTAPESFDIQSTKNPDKIALVYGDVTLTYRELHDRSARFAQYLKVNYRLMADDLVGLLMEPSEKRVIALLGILKSGGAYIPLEVDTPVWRLNYILKDSGCTIVVTDRGDTLQWSGDIPLSILAVDENVGLSAAGSPEGFAAADPPGNLACVLYESDVSGFPRGAALEHRNLANSLEVIRKEYAYSGEWSYVSHMGDCNIYILDSLKNLLPAGAKGEIYVGGSAVCRGYLNRPELTAANFIKNPFEKSGRDILYRTGDMGRYSAAGDVVFMGRNDNQLRHRGYRIEPAEIEFHALAHEAIKEAVISVENDADTKEGKCLTLYYVPSQSPFDVDTFKGFLSQRLPSYMLPDNFIELAELPLTSDGKLDHSALPAPLVGPRNEIERKLYEIWRKLLGMENIGVNDDFFQLGGDSIKALLLVSELNTEFNLNLLILDIYQLMTIEKLAVFLSDLGAGGGNRELQPESDQSTIAGTTPLTALTPMQEGMLFHSLAEKNSSAYFNQFSYRLHGTLDVPLVEKSFNRLFQRYDILRAVFIHAGTDRPFQVVLEDREVEFYVKDLRTWTGEEKKKFIKRFKEKDLSRSFDLSKDVLMRIALIRLDEVEYEFTWSFHHILIDGWSLGILISDFFEIYKSLLEKRECRLLPVRPYRLYIEWLEKQDREKSQEFWTEYLAGYREPALMGSLKSVKAAVEGYNEEQVTLTLDSKKTGSLNELARRNQVTVNTVIQAVWGILLARYTNKEDIVFGAVVSGRPSTIKGVETMVGLFINTIPVRICFRNRDKQKITFKELLQKVHKDAMESEPHHYYPLSRIQSESALKQDLLDHIIVFENVPVAEQVNELLGKNEEDSGGIGLRVSNIEEFGHTNYDFNIIISHREQMNVVFSYNANDYEREFIERTADHFARLIARVLTDDRVEVEELEVLGEIEINDLVKVIRSENDKSFIKTLESNKDFVGNLEANFDF